MRRTSILMLAIALAAGACSGGSGDGSASPAGPSGSSGTFNLRITDSPYSKAQAVLVTFSEVSMHRDGNWIKVPFAGGATTRTCDLKKLQNSAQDLLGTGPLAAGQYTMIRLMVQSAKVYHDTPATSPTPCAATFQEPAGGSSSMTIPSGEVKLNGSFSLVPAGTTTILVDFDGEQSISQTGNGTYMMSPVVRIVSIQ